MDINEVYKLMGNFENSSMTELNLEMEGVKLSMKKGSVGYERPVQAEVQNYVPVVKKEVVEAKDALVQAETKTTASGDAIEVILRQQVKKGDVVGIVEAMKLMNEIVATEDGVVESILVEDGTMVEYNEVLIRLSK